MDEVVWKMFQEKVNLSYFPDCSKLLYWALLWNIIQMSNKDARFGVKS